MAKFKLTDKVTDLDGHNGTIVKVTEWEGSVWYDVRFGKSGVAVRYAGDLRLQIHEGQ